MQRIHSDFIHLLGRSPNITLSLNISTEGKLIEPAILTFHYKATVFSWQKHFRMLRMLETGLVTQWGKQNEQQPLRHEQCLDSSKSQNNNKRKESGHLVRISLANLKGSFVILITGIIISAFIFTTEMAMGFFILLFGIKTCFQLY